MKIIRVSEEDWDSNVDRIAALEAELKTARELLIVCVDVIEAGLSGMRARTSLTERIRAFLDEHHD